MIFAALKTWVINNGRPINSLAELGNGERCFQYDGIAYAVADAEIPEEFRGALKTEWSGGV